MPVKRHGLTRTRTYRAWQNMKARCMDPKNKSYEDYGAKGIRVCDRWLSFDNFLQDMGVCPPSLTLERKDNLIGYQPDNCVWADRLTQGRNRGYTRRLTYGGETKTLQEWASILGIRPRTLSSRIYRGWSVARALIQGDCR